MAWGGIRMASENFKKNFLTFLGLGTNVVKVSSVNSELLFQWDTLVDMLVGFMCLFIPVIEYPNLVMDSATFTILVICSALLWSSVFTGPTSSPCTAKVDPVERNGIFLLLSMSLLALSCLSQAQYGYSL